MNELIQAKRTQEVNPEGGGLSRRLSGWDASGYLPLHLCGFLTSRGVTFKNGLKVG